MEILWKVKQTTIVLSLTERSTLKFQHGIHYPGIVESLDSGAIQDASTCHE